MALMLAGAVIAQVFNTLGAMTGFIPRAHHHAQRVVHRREEGGKGKSALRIDKLKKLGDKIAKEELRNSKLIRPMNMVTEMYALPAYGTIDPNPLD